MTIAYTDADVSRGKLAVNTGGEDFTVNVTVPVNLTIRNSGDGVVNTGSGNDIVQDYSSGNVVFNLGAGDDQWFASKQLNGQHLTVTGGAGNDVLIDAGRALTDFVYNFNSSNQSGDGHDGIKGFTLGEDHIVLNGITQQEFTSSFSVTNAPGSDGAVITDGTNDGWSVQLLGVHLTEQQLLSGGAFLFS
jgi:hypothetical protein